MFAPLTVFIDLETTGLSPQTDGITEVGAIILRAGEPAREWSRLVRPARPIPPEIAQMTGISNDMVRDAPDFGEVAGELRAILDGALIVAHNARFDYAFLKQAFARMSVAFFAPTLCTARLARELQPDLDSVSLDALTAHYGLRSKERHRALGDARMAHALALAMVRRHSRDAVETAVKRVLRRPSLPKHLPVDTLVRIPETPGVYLFFGLNEQPLYIGKAKNLRERVGAHFSGDWGSERGTRLSEELRRIDWIETAGELSALLLEAELVRTRMPSHNVRLRRRAEAVVLRVGDDADTLSCVPVSSLAAGNLDKLYGPFSSRRAARAAVSALANEHALCLKTLGIERRRKTDPAGTPCFAYQVRRCLGNCCGLEPPEVHRARLRAALGAHALPRWPFDGAVELVERDPDCGREARFIVDQWRVDGEAFDAEVLRIVRPYIEERKKGSRVRIDPLPTLQEHAGAMAS